MSTNQGVRNHSARVDFLAAAVVHLTDDGDQPVFDDEIGDTGPARRCRLR